MKRLAYLFVPLFLLVLSSCNKDKECVSIERTKFVSDTIAQHPYNPRYPGSFWEYDDGSIDSIPSFYTRANVLFAEHISGDCSTEKNRSVLGVEIGSFFYVGNTVYSTLNVSTFGTYKPVKYLVDTIVGKELYHYYSRESGDGDWGESTRTETVEEYYPALLIQGVVYYNVYRIRNSHEFNGSSGWFITHTDRFYAENIGLIVKEKLDDILGAPYRKELVNYHINN